MSAPDRIMVSACGKAIVTGQTGIPDDVEYIRADLVPQWQPIDTAPKDGTGSLTGWLDNEGNFHYAIAWFNDNLKGWIIARAGTPCNPTHWMPLPNPPEGTCS